MDRIRRRWLILLLSYILTSNVYAIDFLSLNAYWLWDDHKPHEGAVIKELDPTILSGRYVAIKTFAIASLIKQSGAEVVVLNEIENENVLKLIIKHLPDDWKYAFKQGRDTYTGQDVGVLTNQEIVRGTISTHSLIQGKYKGQTKTPSKLLGLAIESEGQSYYVIGTHLLSKRNNTPSKDVKRAAQADALYKIAQKASEKYDHVVLMGDLNDVMGSQTLKEIINKDDSVLVQTAKAEDVGLFSLKYNKTLIDYILVSRSLENQCSGLEAVETGGISDHQAVFLGCD